MHPSLPRHPNELILQLQQTAANDEERQAYQQFVRDYSVQIHIVRKSVTPNANCRFSA